MKNRLKKLGHFLCSMQVAITLLVILAIICAVGSTIPQGQTLEVYTQQYSQRTAALIIATGMDDLFHSWWLIALTAFLCCNLLACDIRRFPVLWKKSHPKEGTHGPVTVQGEGITDTAKFLESLQMNSGKAAEKDGAVSIRKHSIGHWGAWICHIGVLLLIVGFTLGQQYQRKYSVYGVAGQTKALADTGLLVTIDDFDVDLREDDTVSQYTAKITVESAEEKESAQVSVNHPADLFGLRFYQNSTGWAATVKILKNEEVIQEEVLCAGEGMHVEDNQQLLVMFNAFYPDYIFEEGVGPKTKTGSLKNPAYLYSLYYGEQMLGMNVLEGDDVITASDYTIEFSEPQTYTVLQVKRDRFAWLAFLGGAILMLGLILAFYLQPCEVWTEQAEDGSWMAYGSCRKGGVLFKEQFGKAVEAAGGKLCDPSAQKQSE